MADKSDYLPSARLQDLARGVDPKLRLEPEAEQVRCSSFLHVLFLWTLRPTLHVTLCAQVLQDVADDFVENLAAFACELALHRAGTTLEARDIQLALGAVMRPRT